MFWGARPASFHLVALNVGHTVRTKVMAFRQLLQWSGYLAVVLLQKTGVLPPPRLVFRCLAYFHSGLFFFR